MSPDGFGSEKGDQQEWQERRCGEQHRVSKHVGALMSELCSRPGIPDRPGCFGAMARSNHGVEGIPSNGRAVRGDAAEEKSQQQAFVGYVIDGERAGAQRDQRKLQAAEQLAVELIVTINNAAQTPASSPKPSEGGCCHATGPSSAGWRSGSLLPGVRSPIVSRAGPGNS